MRHTNTSALSVAATLAIATASAQATLQVYEGFDYTNSGSVNMYGQTAPLTVGGNSGFIAGSSYKSGIETLCQPGSLFYGGSFTAGSGIFPSVGGKIRSNIGGGAGQYGLGSYNSGGSGAAASGARPFGSGSNPNVADTVASGTYYYSFLWANQNASSTARGYMNVFSSVPDTDTAGSNAYQDGIGVRFDAGNFGVNSLNSGAVIAGTNAAGVTYNTAPAGTVFLIVGKAVIDNTVAGGTTNQFWVNPTAFATDGTISGGFASGVASLNTTGTGNPQKMTFGTRSNGGGGNTDWYWDEVRVGTSLSDVVSIITGPVSSQWNNTVGGTWNLAGNWSAGIPDGGGTTATFGSNPPGLSASGTVTLDGSRTAGHVVFNNSAASYTIAQGTSGTLNIDNTGVGATGVPSIDVNAGTHTISAPVALANGVTVTTAAATSLTVSGALSGTGPVTKSGGGTLALTGAVSYTGATTVNGGKLSTVNGIQNGAAMSISGGGTVEVVGNGSSSAVTSIGNLTTTGAGSHIEIHDNDLVLDYGAGASTYAATVSKVLSGLTLLGGAGTDGITSAEVDAQTIGGTVLAVVDDGDPNIGGGITTLSGYIIPNPTTSILVKYTWFGDANLDGIVDGSDYALTDTGFTSSGLLGGWVFGDYDYNGVVDGGDYALQDTGFIAQTGTLPEPATLSLMCLGAMGMIRRRYRA